MKRFILILLIVSAPSLLMAQAAGGTIKRSSKKTQTTSSFNKTLSPKAHKVSQPPKKSKEDVLQNLIKNMVYVEGGSFLMGSTKIPQENERDYEKQERPAHQVKISSFYIGKYEITQEEWEIVMGNNPSHFIGTDKPVEQVSWDDCMDFISKLNEITNKNFRLPTEAEWEYAARGGKRSKNTKYAGDDNIANVAWYSDNSEYTTHRVGLKKPNELGLYDMSGNVWEWCGDWYDGKYYSSSPYDNPKGPSSGRWRVYRGGSWYNPEWYSRITNRVDGVSVSESNIHVGLRLVLDNH